MQLSNEDNLRLNVLLAQSLHAVRINEATLTVHALTEKGEAKVQLNPTVRDEQYLRWVREFLSSKVTGSPGGYPVFLKRWTRMGHARNNLEQMLLLGEPEAVAAVVHSPDISHEIGRRAWWADPNAANARRLLEKKEVATGTLGKELASYLLEFLPFEEIPLDVVDTVKLCLQRGLITDHERDKLWRRAKRKNPFYVGFLYADAEKIPLSLPEHPNYATISGQLNKQIRINNPYANALQITLSANGQRWLQTLLFAVEKPVDQDVVIALFKAIQKRFNLPFPEQRGISSLTSATQRAEMYIQRKNCPIEVNNLLDALDNRFHFLIKSLLILGQLGEDSLNDYFAGNDSVGSVMRKRLKPLVGPISSEAHILLGLKAPNS